MEPGVAFHARQELRKQEQEQEQQLQSATKKEHGGDGGVGKEKKRDPYSLTAYGGTGEEELEIENLASVSVFPVGPTQTNCVLVLDNETATLTVINPGGDFGNIVKEIKTLLAQAQLEATRITHILLTSGHVGNMMALKPLLAICEGRVDVCLHERDSVLYDRARLQATELGFDNLLPDDFQPLPQTNFAPEHDQELISGRVKIKCLHTPGSSPGAMCYYFPQLNIACTGDTLLTLAVGRTSWMGIKSLEGTGNARVLRRSIDEVLMEMVPSDATVIPGHGPITNLRAELHQNAFLRKLSHRWSSYDDAMKLREMQAAEQKRREADPYGDGLPF